MSKMSDMAMAIEELRSAAAAIYEAANWLAEQFGGTSDSAPVEKPAAKEEKKPDLKLEIRVKNSPPRLPSCSANIERQYS